MAHMKTFGPSASGGSDRVAYSAANKEALGWLSGLMEDAGLAPTIDLAGNLVGRREGKRSDLAPIVTGSHIDTVPNGGHYDGIVGVMSAVEVARTLHENNVELEHPFEVVVWSNEEAGKIGSRSWMGSIQSMELGLQIVGDKNIGDGTSFLGGDPDRIGENERQPGDVASYIELHIEQGAILDRAGIPIGVVEGIVGIRRWTIQVDGFANHAGTTPMDQRQDALYPAALMVAEVRRIVTSESGRQVGTVGRLRVSPDTPNVIPGRVMFTLEIRDLDMEKIGRLYDRIKASAEQIAAENDVSVSFLQYYESPAAIADDRVKGLVQAAADTVGLQTLHMPSGAGHDAQSLKDIAPLGMIFVPSRDGVSHAPTEFTTEQHIADGANVLLHTILGMDRAIE